LVAVAAPEATVVALQRRSAAVTLVANGLLGVDVFFVVTGLLAARELLPLLRAPAPGPRAAVLAYYARRAARIAPEYLLGIAAATAAAAAAPRLRNRAGIAAQMAPVWFAGCPTAAWRNALALNNLEKAAPPLPFSVHGCALHTWSMAVTLQCYLFLPLALLALRPRARGFARRALAALAALAAVALAARLAIDRAAGRLHMPLSYSLEDAAASSRTKAWATLYFPTLSRALPVAAGLALGAALAAPAGGALTWARHHARGLGAAALALEAAAAAAGAARWHGAPGEPAWLLAKSFVFLQLLWNGSPLAALATAACIAALVLETDPLHRAAARALSSRPAARLGELSYALYCLHVPVLFAVLAALESWAARPWAALVAASPGAALGVMAGGTVAGSLAAAWAADAALSRVLRRKKA
jgi:peptidoglycan/LPS O-acetylase OafA/YrhL